MRHRIAIFSDTHGHAPPPVTDVMAVLHAGDVYDGAKGVEGMDLAGLRGWIAGVRVPVLAVRGNHDFADPGDFFRTARDVTGLVQDGL